MPSEIHRTEVNSQLPADRKQISIKLSLGENLFCLSILHGFYRIFHQLMSLQLTISGLLNSRTLLVFAALICLCISSNVGLEFFPLPAATTQVTLSVQKHEVQTASKAPMTEADGFRVPMISQSKKRIDEKPPQSAQLISLLAERCPPPGDVRSATENSYSPRLPSSPSLAVPAGRAPPPSS